MSLGSTALDVVRLGRLDDVGPALRSLRERAGVSADTLASQCRQLGVRVSTELVWAWEGSVVLPSLPELVAALMVLKVSPASLFVEVQRRAWRGAIEQGAEVVELLVGWWRHAPVEQLLVLLAGRLEGVESKPLETERTALRERLRSERGALTEVLEELFFSGGSAAGAAPRPPVEGG